MVEECYFTCKNSVWKGLVELSAYWIESYDIILSALLFLAKLCAFERLIKLNRHRHIPIVKIVGKP